ANYHYYPKRGLEKIVLTGHFPRFLLCCEIDFTDKKNIRDVVSQYKNISNDDLPLIFSGFLSKCKSGGYGVYPPFDYVSLVGHRSKNIYQIPFHEVSFVLKELE
ncbi:MAG: hypothetical protein KKH06_01630, partial [Gammaproteobacteria bacterium]|nr:hypothetical protein [Gammaproteobacteria bacterium]